MALNGYFMPYNKRVVRVDGYRMPDDWWSRPYEYAWAIDFAREGQVAADMGCGWMYRPFRYALGKIAAYVYAVDADERLLDKRPPSHGENVVADFTRRIDAIPEGSLDTVYCISVLEELGGDIKPALAEFKRVMKPKGRIVLTMDTRHDNSRGGANAVSVRALELTMYEVGLRYVGEVDYNRTNAVYHDGYNLCCFHAVLERDDG